MKPVFLAEQETVFGADTEETRTYPMYQEGRSMLTAVNADFSSLPDIATTIADHSYYEWPIGPKLVAACDECDYSLFIAPEGDHFSEDLFLQFKNTRAKSLNSSIEAIRLTADKLKLFYHWRLNDILTPRTVGTDFPEWDPPRFHGWSVVKDRAGAGSQRTFLAKNDDELGRAMTEHVVGYGGDPIIQQFVYGRAASVALLIGPNQAIPLRATFQVQSDDGRFHYLGGQLPIEPELEAQAISLGHKAVKCVPGLSGYVGVDLVLAEDVKHGSLDYAIEINPRLTTSYVGLRVLADFNIAQAMIDVVEGRPVDYVKWKPGRVQFWPDGRVEYDPTPGAVYS